jgi:hypothetical protein
MEQEVCQLLLAALGQKTGGNWQKIAVLVKKSDKKPPDLTPVAFKGT